MTAEEKLREQIHDLIGDCLISIGCGAGGCPHAEQAALEAQETLTNAILDLIATKVQSFFNSYAYVGNIQKGAMPRKSIKSPRSFSPPSWLR